MPKKTPVLKKTPVAIDPPKLARASAKAEAKAEAKAGAKVGAATRLAAVQQRYRLAMLAVYDQPPGAWAGLMGAAVSAMLAEKAALGIRDGEEAAAEG